MILHELRAAKDRLDRGGIPWALFAGAAAHCYGSRRSITDVDILVRGTDLEKAKSLLQGLKKVEVVADLEIGTKRGLCRFYMDEEMMKRVRCEQLLGIEVQVIPIEDNIIFKAILQRGEEEGKHDVEDIEDMLRGHEIDAAYLRERILKCQAADAAYPLLRRLGAI